MQGNSGGGGGLLAGYIIAKNPSLIPLGAAALAVGLGIYTVADMHDAPKRIPFAEDIVATSLEKCFNAQTHPEYYKEILKKELLKVWSSDLQAFKDAKKDMTICVDPALKTFELSGEHTEMGTVYKDIYRTMGLVYTKGGQETLVYRPYEMVKSEYTQDAHPDMPLNLAKVLKAVSEMPDDVYQHALPDGTKVSAYLQHDGTTQAQGSSKINDNDGAGWSDATHMQEIAQKYTFAAPSMR